MMLVCPNCGRTMTVPPVGGGAQIRCPHCAAVMGVPPAPPEAKPGASAFPDGFFRQPPEILALWIGGAAVALTILIAAICGAAVLFALDGGDVPATVRRTAKREVPLLSPKGEMARDYIEHELPAGQRAALLYGGGGPYDKENVLTNLMKDGQLDGAIEYLSSMQK